MLRYVSILLMMFFCTWLGVLQANAQEKADPSTAYQLVWADEFNTDGPPDSSNWSYERGFVRNQEAQWYQPENAYCKDGYLILEARRESKPNPGFEAGSRDWRTNRKEIQYSSASIITRGKQQWQYGRFIMRGRIDISKGIWPAWWMLGVEKRWPSNGEIDIMEYYRDSLLANIAIGTDKPYQAYWFGRKKPVDLHWASQFHIWRMDWTPEFIALYVDEELMLKVPMEKLVNKDGSNFYPFKQPQYMLLDLAIGGMNGGDPSATTMPRKFEVDYVRVYQKK